MTLISNITPDQSEPGNNHNERVLYTSQSSRTGASLSNAVLCHTLEFQIILNIISNGNIQVIDGALTGTTTPGQSEPRNNGNKGVTSNSLKL